MVLSDHTIKEELAAGRIVIDPLGDGCIQPASVDLHLDQNLLVFRNSRRPFIDVRQDMSDLTEMEEIDRETPFMLHPGEFVLASTLEEIELPDDLVARLEGKSSLGRIGLLIHSTAGYVDPGWKGHLTLELSNVSNLPVTLYYGMKIGQLSFLRLTTAADVVYGSPELGSKYQGRRCPRRAASTRTSNEAPGRGTERHDSHGAGSVTGQAGSRHGQPQPRRGRRGGQGRACGRRGLDSTTGTGPR